MAATSVEIGYRESREITRREAKNFYYAFLTLPQERRRAIYVAYAFCRYCDDAVDSAESVDQKTATLQSLHASLSDAYTGRTNDPLFLALADVVARTVRAPAELPIGVITAFIGAPFFLLILRRQTLS